MALKLGLALQQLSGCMGLKLYETTGAYDDPDNLGGYGAPNPEIDDVTSAIIQVTFPDGETIVSLDVTDDFAAIFPNTNDDVALEVSNEDLGLSVNDVLPHGIWTFVYTIRDEALEIISQGTFKFIIDCTLRCCLDNLLATLDDCGCCSDNKANTQAMRVRMAYIYLAAAHSAYGCGKVARTQELLDFVSDVCAATNCNCS